MNKMENPIDIFNRAYKYHMMGFIDKAIKLYEESIEKFSDDMKKEKALAYTFLGWAKSTKKELEEAIELCKKAIEIYPDLGNPYNDIGVYLLELGKKEEAKTWFKLAKLAKDYDSRELPYMNLANVYLSENKLYEALKELDELLSFSKDYKPAIVLKHTILSMLN